MMRPKLWLVMPVSGPPRMTRLKRLKTSQRKSRRNRSVNWKLFCNEAFSFRLLGRRACPLKRGALPSVLVCGTTAPLELQKAAIEQIGAK